MDSNTGGRGLGKDQQERGQQYGRQRTAIARKRVRYRRDLGKCYRAGYGMVLARAVIASSGSYAGL